MKEIKLGKSGLATQVNDDDYEELNKMKWHLIRGIRTNYAYTVIKNSDGKYKSFLLHRIILNTPKGMEVDHIDHNGLNNQRNNIRNATRSQNKMNVVAQSNTGYLGIYILKGKTYKNKKYKDNIVAKIMVNRKSIYLGTFIDIGSAILARDEAAKKYHGEFANLNLKT